MATCGDDGHIDRSDFHDDGDVKHDNSNDCSEEKGLSRRGSSACSRNCRCSRRPSQTEVLGIVNELGLCYIDQECLSCTVYRVCGI